MSSSRRVSNDAVALVFFSGYGLQSGGHTYLIPVDAAIWNEQDVKTVGFNLDRILSDLAARGARLRLVIVDGARRNPYERRFRPTGQLGMAAVNGTPGTLTLYSSLPGASFEESGGSTSPFVDALITAIRKPGALAEEAFRRARADAARVYKGSQTPWVSSFLDEDTSLDGGDCHASPTTAQAAPPASPPSVAAPTVQPSTAPGPARKETSPTRPEVTAQVPARPVSPSGVTAQDAPQPAAPQAAAPPAPRQTAQSPEVKRAPTHSADQTAMVSSPPAPASSAPDVSKAQPTVSATPSPIPAPAVSTASPSPTPAAAPRVPDQVAAQAPSPSQPAPVSPQAAPTSEPGQVVATTVPASPGVSVDSESNEPITDPERLKETNDLLYDRGFDPGAPGSSQTRSAILDYERQASLPLAEQPTTRLLSNLRSAPAPTPWAAITVSRDEQRTSYGMSWGRSTRRGAIDDAQASCRPAKCIEVVSFSGLQCGAFARSPSGWSVKAKDDEAQAREAALAMCKQQGPNCAIISAVCADGSQMVSAIRSQTSANKAPAVTSTARVPVTRGGSQTSRKRAPH